MKKALVVLAVLFLVGTASAADMVWDYDEAADTASTGYVVLFSDGVNNFNKSFLKSETVVDGVAQKVVGIETKLNLNFGVAYTFNLIRHNIAGPSAQSNTATWTRTGYSPPADVLPVAPVGSPGQINNLILE